VVQQVSLVVGMFQTARPRHRRSEAKMYGQGDSHPQVSATTTRYKLCIGGRQPCQILKSSKLAHHTNLQEHPLNKSTKHIYVAIIHMSSGQNRMFEQGKTSSTWHNCAAASRTM
jgi:hypothetical protein